MPTVWSPMFLIGLPISTARLSSAGPPAFFTARVTSAGVTAPNSLPVLPAWAGRVTESASSWVRTSLA